jgi:hypothetical protein
MADEPTWDLVAFDEHGRRRGVLEQERRRQAMWEHLGLPDPVRVLGEESLTRDLYGPRYWRHPQRAELDEYLTEHPELKPNNWDRR